MKCPSSFAEHLFGEKRFLQISADTGVFAALESGGDVLVWSTSERSGFGEGAAKLAKRASRVAVGEKAVWLVEAAEEAGSPPGKSRGRLWQFRNCGGKEAAAAAFERFRRVGGALAENPFVEELSACGGGVLAIVQYDGDGGMNAFNLRLDPKIRCTSQ